MARRILLFLVALLMALVGTGAVFVYVDRVDARAAEQQQAVDVLVAGKVVPQGTTLASAVADGLVVTEKLPANALPDGYLAEVGDAGALVAAGDMFPGEPVLRARLTREVVGQSSLSIPAGKLAVTVHLEDPQRVAGFVVPGSEIAVFETFNVFKEGPKGRTPSGDRIKDEYEYNRATRLLLARATVIGVGETTTRPVEDSDKDKDKDADKTAKEMETVTLVTLAVDQPDAERVIHGTETGNLYFALLTKESKVAPSDGVDSRTLFGDDWSGGHK
jgi:pilus assembly protein CpaB